MIDYLVFWLELFGLALGVCLLAMCLFVAVEMIESWGGRSPGDWRRW